MKTIFFSPQLLPSPSVVSRRCTPIPAQLTAGSQKSFEEVDANGDGQVTVTKPKPA